MNATRLRPLPSFTTGLRTELRVIGALMVRDVMARYGHENIGFFWVIGEPILLILGVMVLWSLTGQTHGAEDVGVIPFALTGYSYLTLWRHMAFKAMRVMRNGSNLVYHGNVTYFDVLISRGMLETVGIFAAFLITLLPFWLLKLAPGIHDPLLVVGGWLLCAWFSFAFSLIVAAASELSEAVEQFIGPMMYLTMPLTGAFFFVDWLPQRAQTVLLYSPMVHASEMFRAGLFPPDIATTYDVMYLLYWCIALTMIAIPFVNYAQRHVQIS